MSCCGPLLQELQVSTGPYRFRRCMPVGEEEGKGRAWVCSPEGKHTLWVLCPSGFISLTDRNLRGGLRAGLRAGFQQNIYQLSGVSNQSPLIV